MTDINQAFLVRGSLAVAAAGSLARPYIANAAASTATVWWTQGFAQEEDVAFKKIVADYEKASGNTIDYSIIPFAPVAARRYLGDHQRRSPRLFMEFADFAFVPLFAWNGQAGRLS